MATPLTWEYEGAKTAKHGPQSIFMGDTVIDDVLGAGKAVAIVGAYMTIDFKSEDDEVEQQQCTKGHVYALAQRDPEARGERKAPSSTEECPQQH